MIFPILEMIAAAAMNTSTPDMSEVKCLAQNIYHEARGEVTQGQLAVAHVTLNRVEAEEFPDTVCGVVFQRKQFSWTIRGDAKIKNKEAYEKALALSIVALAGVTEDPTHGATYFFAHNTVTPRWSRAFKQTAIIGQHTFKKE